MSEPQFEMKRCTWCQTPFGANQYQNDKIYCTDKCKYQMARAKKGLEKVIGLRYKRPIREALKMEEIRKESKVSITTNEHQKLWNYIEKKYQWYKSDAYLDILLAKLKLYENDPRT